MILSFIAAVALDASAGGTLLDLPREPVPALAGEALVIETAGPGDGTAAVRGALLLPPGAHYDAATGRFTWTPEPTHAGEHRLELWAVSGSGSESGSLTILVESPVSGNDAPVTFGGCDCQRVPEPASSPQTGAASLTAGALAAMLARRRRMLGP